MCRICFVNFCDAIIGGKYLEGKALLEGIKYLFAVDYSSKTVAMSIIKLSGCDVNITSEYEQVIYWLNSVIYSISDKIDTPKKNLMLP